ncbi:MAG: hypothetical protein JOZ24_04915, partial [Candidatus Eremiobacteraeota bacterium]|nr:hypothetical protein [Candidatus Eremiobacteraeota bacterium]
MGGRRNSSAAKKRTRDPFPLAAVLGLVRAAGALWRALLRWDPEIVGIVALGLALLLGIALAAPAHSGALGRWTHGRLDALFGAGAPLFAILVGLLAAIVFVERDVPRAIAALGGSACGYFAIVEAALALWHHRGGAAGATLGAMLRGALGDAGAWVVLLIALLAITVGVTGISLKEAASHSQRPLAVLRERAAAWRPTRLPALAGATFAPPAPVRFYDEPLGVDPDDDADEDDDDGDDDDEYEEDADSDEDADIDEDGDDDE